MGAGAYTSDVGGAGSAGGVVTTVLGPVPASELGIVDAHDHLFLRSPALDGQELDDLDRSVAELREGATTGIGCVVEMTPIGCGRRPDLMRAASEATGVHVIACTGYHRDAHYANGHWVLDAPVDLLAERIEAGIIHINDQTVMDEVVNPFGGVKYSGPGSRLGGPEANLEAFTYVQWVTMRSDLPAYPF